jgi:rubrerythrin
MRHFTFDADMAMTFAELSASAARNRLFSQKAKAEGNGQAALLLAAMAEGEEIMARRALIALRGKISALDDYLAEIEDTKARSAGRCDERAGAAEENGEENTADAYRRFAAVTRNHGEQLAGLGGESDLNVCQVCGYIAAGESPERCPVCNAVAKKFKAFSL